MNFGVGSLPKLKGLIKLTENLGREEELKEVRPVLCPFASGGSQLLDQKAFCSAFVDLGASNVTGFTSFISSFSRLLSSALRISAFHSYELILSTLLSIPSFPLFVLLSVRLSSISLQVYLYTQCVQGRGGCQLFSLPRRTLTKMLLLYIINECHFLTRRDQAIGKLAPSSLSNNASSFPIGCSTWFVLKEKISFFFPLCS